MDSELIKSMKEYNEALEGLGNALASLNRSTLEVRQKIKNLKRGVQIFATDYRDYLARNRKLNELAEISPLKGIFLDGEEEVKERDVENEIDQELLDKTN